MMIDKFVSLTVNSFVIIQNLDNILDFHKIYKKHTYVDVETCLIGTKTFVPTQATSQI